MHAARQADQEHQSRQQTLCLAKRLSVDCAQMKHVNAYCKRHLKQGNSKDPEHSKWRYSLMNWVRPQMIPAVGKAANSLTRPLTSWPECLRHACIADLGRFSCNPAVLEAVRADLTTPTLCLSMLPSSHLCACKLGTAAAAWTCSISFSSLRA